MKLRGLIGCGAAALAMVLLLPPGAEAGSSTTSWRRSRRARGLDHGPRRRRAAGSPTRGVDCGRQQLGDRHGRRRCDPPGLGLLDGAGQRHRGDAGRRTGRGGGVTPAAQRPHRRHVAHGVRQRLLAGRQGRWHLHLRRRPVPRLDGQRPAQPAGVLAWPRPRTVVATGSWPTTEASSRSATLASTARWATSASTNRSTASSCRPPARGYQMVARDGGVFNFGDSKFYGSLGNLGLDNIVGLAPTPTGKGYWLLGGRSEGVPVRRRTVHPITGRRTSPTGPMSSASSPTP